MLYCVCKGDRVERELSILMMGIEAAYTADST